MTVVVVAILSGSGTWVAANFIHAERVAVMEQRIALLERLVGSGAALSGPSNSSQMGVYVTARWPLFVIAAMTVALIITALVSAGRKFEVGRLGADMAALRAASDAKANAAESAQRRAETETTSRLVQLSDMQQQIEEIKKELDLAVVSLKDKKREYAMEVLEQYSNLVPREGTPPITVTVRYANYGHDYDIAQRIQGLFTQYVKWPVALEASNNPALPRADKFKVVFDVGSTYFTYARLVHAISDGDLLGVPVGKLDFVDRDNPHHLIVLVLPSVGSETIQAEIA